MSYEDDTKHYEKKDPRVEELEDLLEEYMQEIIILRETIKDQEQIIMRSQV